MSSRLLLPTATCAFGGELLRRRGAALPVGWRTSQTVIRVVFALGRSLDIPVLAEGIETEGQLALLRREGCDEGQAYLLGRPTALSGLMEKAQRRAALSQRQSNEGAANVTAIRSRSS